MSELSSPSNSPRIPVWKDGLLCLGTALCFLVLIFLLFYAYAWVEGLLPKRLQFPLFFFDFMILLQSPTILPMFKSAQAKGGFPNSKYVWVVAEIAILLWVLISLTKAGPILALIAGSIIFILISGLMLAPFVLYFTFWKRKGRVPRAV